MSAPPPVEPNEAAPAGSPHSDEPQLATAAPPAVSPHDEPPPRATALPDSEPLLTLLALAEAGSESAAAEVLGIGQSSVSRRLASLQRHSDEPLTQRTATGSKLTAAGERLLPHARELRSALLAASRLLGADAAGPLALRFGLTAELAPRFAGPLVAATAGLHQPRFVEASSDGLLAGVRAGELHAALTTWAPAGREPGFVTRRVAGDRLVYVSTPGGAIRGGRLHPAGYRRRALLLPPDDGGVGTRARAAQRAAGLEPGSTVTLGSQAAVLSAALTGAGVGVALASACQALVTAGWLESAELRGQEAASGAAVPPAPGAQPSAAAAGASQVDVWLLLSDALSERDAEQVNAAVDRALELAPGEL